MLGVKAGNDNRVLEFLILYISLCPVSASNQSPDGTLCSQGQCCLKGSAWTLSCGTCVPHPRPTPLTPSWSPAFTLGGLSPGPFLHPPSCVWFGLLPPSPKRDRFDPARSRTSINIICRTAVLQGRAERGSGVLREWRGRAEHSTFPLRSFPRQCCLGVKGSDWNHLGLVQC